jgi:DNA-binding response OmpR family regulator
MMPGTVLVVDDDVHIRDITKFALEKAGYTVSLAADGEEALCLYYDVDVMILDLCMPKVSGIDVMKRVRADGFYTPVIIITGSEAMHREDVEEYDIVDFIRKPFSMKMLMEKVEDGFRVIENLQRLHEASVQTARHIDSCIKLFSDTDSISLSDIRHASSLHA